METSKKNGSVPISPSSIENAKEGYVVAVDGKGKLKAVDPSYIVAEANAKSEEAMETVGEFRAFQKHVKHFRKVCKSHFFNAFSLWKIKVMEGDVVEIDESLLNADDDVLSGKKSVVNTLEENESLKAIFEAIYGTISDEDMEAEGETATFPEV